MWIDARDLVKAFFRTILPTPSATFFLAGLLTFCWFNSPLAGMPSGGDLWLTKAHDGRRTGQSAANGPLSIDESRTWKADVPAAFVVNIGASVYQGGAIVGSWGLVRSDPEGRGPKFIDKFDGKVYGFDRSDGSPLWGGAVDLDLTPFFYDFQDRSGATNFHNGTVEGQAAIDTARDVFYLGRGDGKLYAIDLTSGAIRWRFKTFNPDLPDDPDGGGELIAAPLLGPDGAVYVGSWGVGPHETNAIYCINPDGSLRWRYPAASSLSMQPIFSSPAFSPDMQSVYFSTWFQEDPEQPGVVFALRVDDKALSDSERLKWRQPLQHKDQAVWTTTMAVGSDGVLYIGGFANLPPFAQNVPLVTALRDEEEDDGAWQAVPHWDSGFLELRDGAQFIGGIALREVEGQTLRLYLSTANIRNNNNREAGALHAVAADDGQLLASYDPSDDVPAAVGGLNSPAIGADGTIYVGVRGKFKAALVEPVNGHVFAINYNQDQMQFSTVWNYEVEGHIEWNHPAIGPDGGLYIASSFGGATDIRVYEPGQNPDNATARMYALKGPAETVGIMRGPSLPDRLTLYAPGPNPCDASALIEYFLPWPAVTQVQLIDQRGGGTSLQSARRQEAGRHRFVADLRGLAAGVYLCVVSANGERAQATLIVFR